jgi:hypothetical protein
MKKTILLAATILLGTGALMGSASAQPQFQFGIDEHGRPQFGVRDPERERWERREYWRQRREEEARRAYEAGRRDAYRDSQRYGFYEGRGCRNITVQEQDEWGRTRVKRIRRCG